MGKMLQSSLRSRRLEVVGERENGRARGRHACLVLSRAFFLVPTTSKRLLRRLASVELQLIYKVGICLKHENDFLYKFHTRYC